MKVTMTLSLKGTQIEFMDNECLSEEERSFYRRCDNNF